MQIREERFKKQIGKNQKALECEDIEYKDT